MTTNENRIVIEYDEGTVAIWMADSTTTDRIEALIVEILGQPDTLHT